MICGQGFSSDLPKELFAKHNQSISLWQIVFFNTYQLLLGEWEFQEGFLLMDYLENTRKCRAELEGSGILVGGY